MVAHDWITATYRGDLMRRLLRLADRTVRPAIKNKRLQQSMKVIGPHTAGRPATDSEGGAVGLPNVPGVVAGALFVRDFWAIAIHNGSRSFGPGAYGSRVLCWYRNPMDDPRKDAGYQVRYAKDYRRLTKAEYYAGVAENRRRYLANPRGGRYQFLYIHVHPRGKQALSVKAVPGTFFFTHGVHILLLKQRVRQEAHNFTVDFVRKHLPPEVVAGTRLAPLSLRLG